MPRFLKKIWINTCCPSYRPKNEVLLTIITVLARGRAKKYSENRSTFFEAATRHNGEFVK
jgi:hypothetical protein